MRKAGWMAPVRVALVVGSALGMLPTDVAAEPIVVSAPADLKWVDAPAGLPKGLKVATLAGDPARPGLVVMRVKLPAHYRVAAHWHPADENVAVLSGTVYVGQGEKLDPAAARAVHAGGFYSMPAQTDHFVFTTKTEAVIQLSAIGPLGIMYVDPRDDPNKAAVAAKVPAPAAK